ncbi:hypothetical protein F5Y06DRAFT_307083 [Hypoxylon sp. FL0890]|nr:hypothetical protein F5Y06DRAFT_307083 [Hypoxylon sp. FL0890]
MNLGRTRARNAAELPSDEQLVTLREALTLYMATRTHADGSLATGNSGYEGGNLAGMMNELEKISSVIIDNNHVLCETSADVKRVRETQTKEFNCVLAQNGGLASELRARRDGNTGVISDVMEFLSARDYAGELELGVAIAIIIVLLIVVFYQKVTCRCYGEVGDDGDTW